MTVPIFDPLFCRLFKLEQIYTNYDCTKYSVKKIWAVNNHTGEKEEFFTYTAGMEHKFPGYALDSNFIVKNVSDINLELQSQIDLFLCKNLDKYDFAI